jgi:Glycosyltransferase family 87
MNALAPSKQPSLDRFAAWLTPRRIRAQALVLAICMWGVCAVDFATPGLFDRADNIKFQDFLAFYIPAQQIVQHRTSQLFDPQSTAAEVQAIISSPTDVLLPALYGPQVGLFFVPLARFSFLTAARLWAALGLFVYFACVYFAWRVCPNLRPHAGTVAIAAIAFPPLFHFFVRGQISVLVLACFTLAFFAFRARHDWLAGIALGFLVFKPQFIVAIPLVLLFAASWKALTGLIISSASQLALTWAYFGSSVMRSYYDIMWHTSRWIGNAEPGPAHIQMHSLRSLWILLLPWPGTALALYIMSAAVVIGLAAATWKLSASLNLRFSALILAAVLVNPHLFVYDLLVLAPILLLLVDWILAHQQNPYRASLCILLYLSFILPMLGPLSFWTHLQLSILAFVVLQWILWRIASRTEAIGAI